MPPGDFFRSGFHIVCVSNRPTLSGFPIARRKWVGEPNVQPAYAQPRELVSPSKREFLQKYRQSTLGVSADGDQYIFMSPGTTLESMNRHTTLCKMNIAKFETFVLIVTEVKKLNMGWKETLFHLTRPTLLENAPDRAPSTLLCTFLL